MGVLWLLSMTIICHTTQRTTAWPGANQSSTSTTKPAYENHTINILEELPLKKSIVNTSEENMREKRGTISNENGIESDLEKSDPMKYKFSNWGGERNHIPEEKRAKFSSWGGKRSYELGSNDIDQDIEEEKRAKFSSWGGKRSDYDAEKRARFSSWAGKRDLNEISEDKRSKFNSWAGKRMDLGGDKRAKFSSWAGKRARFNSWAGKRSDSTFYNDGKRVPFNSWAGKRSYFEPENEFENMEDKRAKFSSWAGKRNYLEPDNDEEISEEKRAKFSSWAGKRTPDYVGIAWKSPDNKLRYYSNTGEQGSENIMKLWQDLMSRKRARFSSWAGKRSDETLLDNESLMRHLEPETDEKRAKFSSWAGKREDTDSNHLASWGGNQGNDSVGDLNVDREYPSMIVKRSAYSWNSPSIAYKRKPIFSSWGGKRSDESHTIQARSLPMQRVLFNGVKDRSWGALLRPIRRGPDFYAWGGKRST